MEPSDVKEIGTDTWDQGVEMVAWAWAELNEPVDRLAKSLIGLAMLYQLTGHPGRPFIMGGAAAIAALEGRGDKEREMVQLHVRSYN